MKKQKIDKELSLESYNQPIVNESWNTYSVQYQVIDRNDRISAKTKEFKTEKALQNWIAKQEDNPNFYGILATSYPDEIKLKEDKQKLNIEDFKIGKTDSGLYKVAYDSRIGYIKPDKSYSKVRRALDNAIYKYNTKDIQANRKALISKLHKLFKQAGIPKMQDMKSSVRGYRPITQNGYYIDTYAGDRTSFYIGLSKFNNEYFVKIKELLDSEGVKYWEGSGHFTVDMEKQDINNESIKEDYDEYDYEDIPEEMHKEIYVTYFETSEGRQKYTIYHVYTDSTDDSYNELCDKRDNQLGMYNSYKELKDALKERAEKIAAKQGWTVKSIENLGEDDEYYKERNKWESIKEGFNKGDKVQLKRKNNKIGIVKSIFNGDKDKNDKDIKYLNVEFEDGSLEGRPASDFRKVNESFSDKQFINTINFNSPEEFKQDLEKARREYKVVDQMEGKDLLHLVYKNGEHIATYNNTKLEKYTESLNEKNIEFEDIKKLNEEIENFLQNT